MNRQAMLLLLGAVALIGTAPAASAHEVYIERDGQGPARVYLREIDQPVEETDESPRLRTATLFTKDPARPAPLVRKQGHFEAAVAGKGDVRLHTDDVFAPWIDGGVKHGQVFHARAGRRETAAKLDFELVPVKSGGSDFTLTFRGRPVAGTPVTVFSPTLVKQVVNTDAAGRVAIVGKDRGRYILIANTSEDVARRMGGQDVARVNHMTTLSYMND